MRGRTCCFPARLCALTLGTGWFILTGSIAAYYWFILSQVITDLTRTDPNALDIDSLHVVLTTKQRILLYIVAGLYSAAFFVCGIGLLSVIVRARKFVVAFLALVLAETLASLVVGAFELYELWMKSAANCDAVNSDDKAACASGLFNLRVALTTAFALALALQLWLSHALYVLQRVMREEKAYEALSHWHAARIPSTGAATSPYAFDPSSASKLNFSFDFDPSRVSKLGSPYPVFTSKTRLNFNTKPSSPAFGARKLGFDPMGVPISAPATALLPGHPDSAFAHFPSPPPAKTGFDAEKLCSPRLGLGGDDYADPYYKRDNFAFRIDLPSRGDSRMPRRSWWGRTVANRA
ncbi:hypothetical protein PENSPDRAFT_666340 [Peniophora sp. CONT]|nr:hypothetical protein PENSPDRAFT_666340 [Peniophora sp. CONT]